MKLISTFCLVCVSVLCAREAHWVATWAASPSEPLPNVAEMEKAHLVFENQTVRETVRVTVGGRSIRVRLSNAFGKQSIRIGAAHVALRNSDRPLKFNGETAVSIPPNAPVVSDPVTLDVPDSADLVISIYLPERTPASGIHYAAQQRNYIGKGDLTAAPAIPDPVVLESWVFLAGVDVLSPSASAVVALGDSITDGARSTVDANHRWPNVLATRLAAKHIAVVNAGIGGNRLLHDATANIRFGVNALARFDRDVLAQPGVRYVVLLEGINDIGHPGTATVSASEAVTAEQMIGAMKQLIDRAHEHGLKIFGATLTPFAGTVFAGYYSPEKDKIRQDVNKWIRTGNQFDGVIDFDAAVHDPANPDRLLPAYDGGDRLHPSDAGYEAMGKAVKLELFR